MKKNLLTLIIVFATCAVQAQWLQQNANFVYEGYLNDIEVVDANTVWANPWDALATLPYTRDFVRTIDGGNTWTVGTVTASAANNRISNIWPIDANTCYVAMFVNGAAGGDVFKTTDGGVTWNQVGASMFSALTSFANIVYFYDVNTGLAIGDPIGSPLKYEIHRTIDAGVTWTPVPAAGLPSLANNAEFGITNLFSAVQGRIWFGTTYGDIYRSIDQGLTWTKTASGFPPYTGTNGRQDISDIAFSDSLHGLAIQATATAYLVRQTTDGGLTWSPITPTGGVFYPGDVEGVPGTNTFVSAGSNATFGFGTSFSNDYGLTWTDLDATVSHTSLDFSDLTTGWSGEYILAGSPGGAYKFTGALASVACGSPLIAPGISTANDSLICFGDTLTVTTAGALAPNSAPVNGFALLVSSADISGDPDPLNSGVILGGTGVITGTPPPIILPNDNSIFPAGAIYWFTPIVFGNATGPGPNITQYTLDPACTYTGASVMSNLLIAGDPLCTVGITENNSITFGLDTYFSSVNTLNVNLNVAENDKATIEIYDLTGRVVFGNTFQVQKGENHFTIETEGLVAGTYIIKAETENSKAVDKLIKL